MEIQVYYLLLAAALLFSEGPNHVDLTGNDRLFFCQGGLAKQGNSHWRYQNLFEVREPVL